MHLGTQNTACIELLLNHGADPLLKDKEGRSVVDCCKTKLDKILVELFMNDMEWIDDIIEIAHDNGTEVDTKNVTLQSLLMLALDLKLTTVANFLLNHGADPLLKDKEGRNALDHCKTKSDAIMVESHVFDDPFRRDNPGFAAMIRWEIIENRRKHGWSEKDE